LLGAQWDGHLVISSRVIGGHHDDDCRAVLAAVQASVLRTDRCAAAGLDRVSAQRVGAIT
jgi:hypothetical protein